MNKLSRGHTVPKIPRTYLWHFFTAISFFLLADLYFIGLALVSAFLILKVNLFKGWYCCTTITVQIEEKMDSWTTSCDKGWIQTHTAHFHGAGCSRFRQADVKLTCTFKACVLQRDSVGTDIESFGLRWMEMGASNADTWQSYLSNHTEPIITLIVQNTVSVASS